MKVREIVCSTAGRLQMDLSVIESAATLIKPLITLAVDERLTIDHSKEVSMVRPQKKKE